jgi:hypothetical protein
VVLRRAEDDPALASSSQSLSDGASDIKPKLFQAPVQHGFLPAFQASKLRAKSVLLRVFGTINSWSNC